MAERNMVVNAKKVNDGANPEGSCNDHMSHAASIPIGPNISDQSQSAIRLTRANRTGGRWAS